MSLACLHHFLFFCVCLSWLVLLDGVQLLLWDFRCAKPLFKIDSWSAPFPAHEKESPEEIRQRSSSLMNSSFAVAMNVWPSWIIEWPGPFGKKTPIHSAQAGQGSSKMAKQSSTKIMMLRFKTPVILAFYSILTFKKWVPVVCILWTCHVWKEPLSPGDSTSAKTGGLNTD